MGKKLWRHYSTPNVSVITRNILITMIRFVRYNNMICQHSHDWFYLLRCNWGATKIVNEYYYFLISTTSVICQIDANCSPFQSSNMARMLKTKLLGLTSIFSKCYFNTGTICLLFLSLHVFTTLEFDSNLLVIVPWKILKPRDHNEIK